MPGVTAASRVFQVCTRTHLIAFVTHQHFRFQDNLLDVLLNVLQTYLNTAQREHKECVTDAENIGTRPSGN